MARLDRALTRPVSRVIGRIILPYLGRKRLRWLRDGVQQNLAAVFAADAPSNNDSARRASRIARRTFSNFGAYIADYFLLPSITKRSIGRWVTASEGIEHLDAAVKRDRGVLLLTCHLGLWELGAIYLRHGGYPVNVVGLVDANHEGITEFRDWMRERQGIGVVNRDGARLAALAIRQLLEEKKIVALLGDRLVGERGVEVEFLGRNVRFPAGPLRLARATDATILPSFVVREGRGYRATIESPIVFGEEDESGGDPLQSAAQELAGRFERHIRAHFDQWYAFSPFWEPFSGFEL
jgi:KDO2-lipid IV(A) lauroyltransferase